MDARESNLADRTTLLEKLNAKIPRDVIALRDAGNGRKLSYLEGWHVIDQLNQIFGQGCWAYSTEELIMRFSGEVNDKFYTSYTAKVKLSVSFGGFWVHFSDIGFGDGTDARNPGKTHELATKEAVTDGLKRCAKNLGMSLGLALYDKTQENVEDGEADTKGNRSAQRPSGNQGVPSKGPAAKQPEERAPVAEAKREDVQEAEQTQDRAQVLKLIGQNAKVIASKKLKSLDDIRADMKAKYGTDNKDDLTDEQAIDLLANLKGALNG